MDSLTLSLEIAAIREQTRRLALWSLMLHAAAAVLFLANASRVQPAPEPETVLTEITWMEETLPLAGPSQSEVMPEPISQDEPDAQVVVQAEPDPVIPPPNHHLDTVQNRLDALREDAAGRRQVTTAAATVSPRPQLTSLGSFVPQPTAKPRGLARAQATPVAAAMPLSREKPDVVSASLKSLAPVEIAEDTPRLQEILPGISLAGEVSDRQLMSFFKPEYPEWAKRDGIEVSVRLYFTVLPSGRIKENILVEQTSGFADFDSRARNALAAWKFQELPAGAGREQWGRIEFKYRLKTAG